MVDWTCRKQKSYELAKLQGFSRSLLCYCNLSSTRLPQLIYFMILIVFTGVSAMLTPFYNSTYQTE